MLPYQGLDETFTDSDDDRDGRRRYNKKQKKPSMSPKEQPSDNFSELYNSLTSPTENMSPAAVNSKTTPTKNKSKKVKVRTVLLEFFITDHYLIFLASYFILQ